MVTLVWDESGVVWHYLSDRLATEFSTASGGFLFMEEGRVIGAVGLYDFREAGGRRQASLVGAADSPKWFRRGLISDVCAMFFRSAPDGMGLSRLNSFIQADNEHSISITERVGFVREGRLRKAGEDSQDVVVLGMLAEECPWLRQEDDRPKVAEDNPPNS